jgi:hypothetical protein
MTRPRLLAILTLALVTACTALAAAAPANAQAAANVGGSDLHQTGIGAQVNR